MRHKRTSKQGIKDQMMGENETAEIQPIGESLSNKMLRNFRVRDWHVFASIRIVEAKHGGLNFDASFSKIGK